MSEGLEEEPVPLEDVLLSRLPMGASLVVFLSPVASSLDELSLSIGSPFLGSWLLLLPLMADPYRDRTLESALLN